MESVDIKKPFGASVKAWRSRLGISQEELAGRAGLHRTYVCDVERGTRNISLESIEKLARALEISTSALFSYGRGHRGESGPAGGMVDILLVEDDARDAELARHALRDVSNRVEVVGSGQTALEFLFREGSFAGRRASQHPQLILLDLGLPGMSGLDVLRRVKSDPRTASIPVIVLTGSNRDQDIEMSRRLGASDYIVKPVELHNLARVTPRLHFRWALLKLPAIG